MMEINKKLCLAIKAKNCKELERLIKDDADPFARIDFDTYFTPLNWLYSCDSYSITSIVLEHFPKAVHYKIPELCDETLLFGAILTENKVNIRLLVKNGADINIMNENGYTPLYYTIGQTEEVRALIPLLLKLGADITVGLKRFKRFEEKDLKDFYDYFKSFLEQLHELSDMNELKKQTDRLLRLKEVHSIPAELLDKVNEIRVYYGFDLEDNLEKIELEKVSVENQEIEKSDRVVRNDSEIESEIDSELKGGNNVISSKICLNQTTNEKKPQKYGFFVRFTLDSESHSN